MPGERLASACYLSPFGWLVAVASERGLVALSLPAPTLEAAWQTLTVGPRATLVEEPTPLTPLFQALDRYFAGQPEDFVQIPLDLRGTPFQQMVWQAIRAIPYGQVRTYGQIARAIGRPRAARAVGQATGANPVPIVVPCHRVVGCQGLGGYGGGLALKERLLALERVGSGVA